MQTIVFTLLIIVLYPYFIYPVFLYVISGIRKRHQSATVNELPIISVIIPVYNGADLISDKVKNLRLVSYPANKLEIICVSDGSTDGTNKTLQSFDDIKVIILDERMGKERAIKEALKHASAELICLTDVGVSINPDGISNMATHFNDSQVGAVSSVDRTDFKAYLLETFHVALENKIRILEANISSSVGTSGSFFMARKTYLEKLPYTCCSDLAIALECVKNGMRVAVEPHAYGYYGKSEDVSSELGRKIRTITHGMNTLSEYKGLLNPLKYGFFSWQLISHKVFRWLSPIALALMLLTVFFGFAYTASLREFLLVSAAIALLLLIPPLGKKIVTNVALFGVYIIAIFSSIKNVVLQKKQVIWEPTQRSRNK